jgi:hypothetical protein
MMRLAISVSERMICVSDARHMRSKRVGRTARQLTRVCRLSRRSSSPVNWPSVKRATIFSLRLLPERFEDLDGATRE